MIAGDAIQIGDTVLQLSGIDTARGERVFRGDDQPRAAGRLRPGERPRGK